MSDFSRRDFLKTASISLFTLSIPEVTFRLFEEKKELKLGLISDLHVDIIHDGSLRLETFLAESLSKTPDCLIQMGDFAIPKPENFSTIQTFNSAHSRAYHVLGNHDMDEGYSREEVAKTFGMPGLYYALDLESIRLIVLDGNDPGSWEKKLKPSTKAIYVETMTNPLIQVADLKAVVDFAKAHHLVSMIDNTFASPINFRPPEWGFDLSLHSCTKYLNGHSDIVAGAVIGKADLVQKTVHKLNHLGGSLDPHACFLLHRGMKTLGVRVRYQNESTLKIARFLENHPSILKVNYPGLPSHPAHERARSLFEGFSGMLSFEVKGGLEAAERFMKKTTLPVIAPSLGGIETLLTRPATTSHAGLSPEERRRLGISEALIRMSVGIESPEDIIDDFEQALKR